MHLIQMDYFTNDWLKQWYTWTNITIYLAFSGFYVLYPVFFKEHSIVITDLESVKPQLCHLHAMSHGEVT